jgi:thioester reductase-like protein/NADP-dependent 3-hydroxy acid dehydrogenase YdfG
MSTYLLTGGTGFVGRHLLPLLLARDTPRRRVTVHVLVRAGSVARLADQVAELENGTRVVPLVGDLTAAGLALAASDRAALRGKVDHVVHLGAVYDLTADETHTARANVDGTRAVVELANGIGAGCFHHVSSVAVAGEYAGRFSEEMFAAGQPLTSAYHRTKYDAERIVREEATVPWRVYRPAIVVGDSRTGEMDKIDGPYYAFGAIAKFSALPAWLPIAFPQVGDTNLVPVDYVASAMDHLMHKSGLDGKAFHLVNPSPQPLLEVVNAFCRAAGAPQISLPLDRPFAGWLLATASRAQRLPGIAAVRDVSATALGIPPEVLPHLTFASEFGSVSTQNALRDSDIQLPELDDYASRLWTYWERNLDPDRARRAGQRDPLVGRTVVITGASSGIGEAAAHQLAARGAVPILVARNAEKLDQTREEIIAAGGSAYSYACDITDGDSVDALVKQLIADHPDGIDMLVNNAGRSIRRSVKLSYDRLHDYERTMALNYFGAVRMILGLLPHMVDRRFGHVVNVSSIGVQAAPPRFSAYVGSKAALDAFSKVVASETYGDHVTFTTIHMPLVRTP